MLGSFIDKDLSVTTKALIGHLIMSSNMRTIKIIKFSIRRPKGRPYKNNVHR